jgi:hypothetical protein
MFYFNEDKFSKAASWFKKTMKLDDENLDLNFAAAACMLLSRNMEGERILDEYLPKIKAYYGSGDNVISDVTKDALIAGFVGYSDYLKENGESTKAIEIITLGKEIMPDNFRIERQYNSIIQ